MNTAQIIARLRRGDKLHMQLSDGKRVWWFEGPHQNIPEKVITAIIAADEAIMETGDSLFGLIGNSQTWEVKDGI
jgi:hypothetical protein